MAGHGMQCSADSHDFEWFWRPGDSLFDDFWVFWVPGNLSWRLGGTFWAQGSDLCDFGDVTPLKKQSLFVSLFHTCWIQFLVFFLSVRFFWIFCDLGCPKHPNGSHLEVILMTFLMTGYFLIFATPILRNLDFWGLEGTQIASFWVTFLRLLSGRPLEHDFSGFWAIWDSLRETIWLQKETKKRDQKRVCG